MAKAMDQDQAQDNLFYTIWHFIVPAKIQFDITLMEVEFESLDNAFLASPTETFNYNLLRLKQAYLYRYFTIITTAVKTCWNIAGIAPNFFEAYGKMNVFSIGGGPGCDLMGIRQWLKEKNVILPINGVIADIYDWSDCTKTLFREMDANDEYNLGNTDFMKQDYFELLNEETIYAIQTADVVTVIMFLSAVSMNSEKSLRSLCEFVKYMRRNSLLHFMDISEDRFADVIMRACGDAMELECLYKSVDIEIEVPPHEAAAIGSYAFLDMGPEKKLIVSTSFWQCS